MYNVEYTLLITSHIIYVTCKWVVNKLLLFYIIYRYFKIRIIKQSVLSFVDQGACWFLHCLLISLRTTSILSSSAVIVLSSNGLPMPLICSEESLTRKEEELDELLDWKDFEELRDVSLVIDDFFIVFCVAVRLHSEFSASLILPQHR